MKLEHLHESVTPTVVIGSALGLAVGCGYLLGNDEAKLVGLLLGAIFVVGFILFARQHIWMVIPALWTLGGGIPALPLPFSVAQIAVMLAFCVFLILKAVKVIRFKPKFGLLEVWMGIVLLYLMTVFVRNPVGVEALGSERVGGKPYASIAIACAGYWVLARSVASARQAVFIPFLSMIGSGIHALLNIICEIFPSLVGPISSVYSGIAAAEAQADPLAPVQEQNGGRLGYVQSIGANTENAACSYWRPLTLINPLHFWRFAMFLVGLACVLLSGFRSNLMGVLEVFLLSSYFRRGWREVFWVLGFGAGALGLIAGLQGNVIDLPLSAQRALSFLPGRWEYAAKQEAEASTEWRMTMWKAMLTTDTYIENKWLGDGFGFTHQQFEVMVANASNGGNAAQQENLMINGGVHSGPVSSIRFVGYVGLVLFLIFLGILAKRAFGLVRRSKGTPFFPMALALGMPAILYPFNFLFIFGAFENDLPYAILTVGYLRLLENSLDAYEGGLKKTSPEVIQPPKARPVRQFAGAAHA